MNRKSVFYWIILIAGVSANVIFTINRAHPYLTFLGGILIGFSARGLWHHGKPFSQSNYSDRT